MKFHETPLAGVVVVELELLDDERGSFARTFDASEWELRGLSTRVAQCNLSRNARSGTLRGLHYQAAPHEEAKLVRCARGAIFDVAVDLRPQSPSLHQWFGLELSEANDRLLYIPEGCAHGFLTLSDASEVLYQMSELYVPDAARGLRWDDPALAIDWPAPPAVISERDRSFPHLL